MPFLNKNEYKIFTFGKTYKIKEECIGRVKELDGYKEFIWSSRPFIWMPILIVSGVISGFISYIFYNDFTHLEELAIMVSMCIYAVLSIVYYIKLRKAINCCL